MKHQGKAVVFECVENMKARLDDPELDVDQNSILVLKNCGPKGYPGMAEVGNMPLPKKILDLAYVTWFGFRMLGCREPPSVKLYFT